MKRYESKTAKIKNQEETSNNYIKPGHPNPYEEWYLYRNL